MNKKEIEDLVKQYNSTFLPGDKRLILAEHDFLCRCQTCWYDYDGSEIDKLYCYNTTPYAGHPSDQEIMRRVAKARELEIKKREKI